MRISSQKFAKALIAGLIEGEQPAQLAAHFKEYLSKNHLMGLIPNIVSHLDKELRSLVAHTKADIIVSHTISPATQRLIEELIGKKQHDAATVSIDPSLIGGFRATYRGRLIDGSVKNYLKELRATLTH